MPASSGGSSIRRYARGVTSSRGTVSPTRTVVICDIAFGILAGYEDQNDHDVLRTDPVFKLIADR